MDASTKDTLTRIGNTDLFKDVIKKITLGQDLKNEEKEYVLTCAIIFLREYKKDERLISYADLAYYIFLKYSLNTNDYKPLYDFSVNFGFYPISKTILDNDLIEKKHINDFIIDVEIENYKHKDGHIETYDQSKMHHAVIEDPSKEKIYIAPTSFGKSALIVDYIKNLDYSNHKIVIIVPTKSLLMQTYRLIADANLKSKILIHDEMYNEKDNAFIAVFTQERALRLMKKGVYFDTIILDEAHKIFGKRRGVLISRLIRKNGRKKKEQKIFYLSPLVENSSNMQVLEKQKISEYHVKFNVKEPEFFEFKEVDGHIYKYNRFVNKFYSIGFESDSLTYVKNNSNKKNFLFETNPQKIEILAKKLCKSLKQAKGSNVASKKAIKELKDILIKEVHEDFNIVEHVDDGVVYIHGQLPELIKEYLEYKFREVKEIKYIIANTVILEGVNFPIDSLFIFGSHIISNGKSLMNLVGRVNRLNEIFKFSKKNVELLENNLYKLLPKVHIINEKEQKEDQHDSKFKHLRSRVFPDVIKNPTLELFDIKKVGPKGTTKEKQEERERFVKRTEKIQAYEKFISNIIDTHRDEVKKYFIENSLNNYYIDTELAIDSFIDTKASILSSDNSEWRLLSMMDKIEKVFIQNPDNIFEYEFKRLQNESARKYYEGYITIAKKKNLKNNIKWQVDKFIEIKNNEELKKLDQQKIYVGESYGDTIWKTENWRDSKREVYAELSNKEGSTLTNLAIVKLQVEENFVSFTLNTFIQALFDFKLISENEYNVYVYGTKNVEKIKLSKQGLSLSLISRLEDDEQLGNLSFENGNIVGNDAFKSFLNSNLVNDFYRFEIQRYIIVNNNQRNGEEMGISTIK